MYKFYVCDRKFLRASVGARHSSSELGSALASRNLVNLLHRRCSVSERLSKFQELKRFVSFTQVPKKALASCTTSVYVNLSKNSLMPFGLDFFHDSENQVNSFLSRCSRSSFHTKRPKIGRKRMQRYEEFQYHPNFFNKKFPKIQRFSGMLTNENYTLFIIYSSYSNISSISLSSVSRASSTNEHGSKPSGISKIAFSL